MASYLLLNSRIRSPEFVCKTVAVRSLFGSHKELIVPPPAAHQLTPPPGVKGHMKYQRYWSNNAKYVSQIKQGDSLSRAIYGNVGEHYELYPFHFLLGVYLILTTLIFYFTGQTIEFGNPARRSWSVIRDKYWKYFITLTDPYNVSRNRLPLMEQLLDEIEEASQKRRAEDESRQHSMKRYEAAETHKKH